MSLLDDARDLKRDVDNGAKTEAEAVAALRRDYALTDIGALDVLEKWEYYRDFVPRYIQGIEP